jgi:hypothetical protein
MHVPQTKNDLDKMKNFEKSVGTSLKPAEKYVHLGALEKFCGASLHAGQDKILLTVPDHILQAEQLAA